MRSELLGAVSSPLTQPADGDAVFRDAKPNWHSPRHPHPGDPDCHRFARAAPRRRADDDRAAARTHHAQPGAGCHAVILSGALLSAWLLLPRPVARCVLHAALLYAISSLEETQQVARINIEDQGNQCGSTSGT